jgi:hypothetical protein
MSTDPIPQAEVEDPVGPGWVQWAIISVGIACLMLGVSVEPGLPRALIGLGMTILVAWRQAVGRFRPRRARLIIRPGSVVIRASFLTRRISADQVVGASASRVLMGRVALAFHLKGRDEAPLVLTVENDATAERVLGALGIGYDGKGSLFWQTAPNHLEPVRSLFHGAMGLCWLLNVVATMVFNVDMTLTLIPFTLLSFFWVRSPIRPGITLSPLGFYVRTFNRVWSTRSQPYAEVARIVRQYHGPRKMTLRFELASGSAFEVPIRAVRHLYSGLSSTQVDQLLSQLQSAVDRSHGRVKPRPELSTYIDQLMRHDEPVKAWLTRVESTAAQVLTRANGSGYRTTETVSPAELWSILESPDADVHARAAAVRILARVEPESVRARIADVLKTVPSEDTRKRIRIVMDPDPEYAALELEALESAQAARLPPR